MKRLFCVIEYESQANTCVVCVLLLCGDGFLYLFLEHVLFLNLLCGLVAITSRLYLLNQKMKQFTVQTVQSCTKSH